MLPLRCFKYVQKSKTKLCWC